MSDTASEAGSPLGNRWFTTTHWTVILAAKEADSPEVAAALERLCQTYWGALYAYIRRSGRSPADAADLTQAFFARCLERQFLNDVDQQKGRFRFFPLKAFNHFLANEWSCRGAFRPLCHPRPS